MIVGASYEGGEVILHDLEGDVQRIPFTPRMLVPASLAPHLPHHLETEPAPGGLYVEAPYPDLLHLYSRLRPMSPAIIFPPPERQFLLIQGIRPFTKRLTPNLPTPASALFHLLLTPSTPDPALTFLENVLFLHGHARPLARRYRARPLPTLYLPFFQFNLDATSFSPDGELILPTSPVRVRGYLEVHSLHPSLGRRVISGEGVVTLADALLHGLEYEMKKEIRVSREPTFLHREISGLISEFFNVFRSLPRDLLPGNPTAYNLLLVIHRTLLRLPHYLVNTDLLGPRARNHLVALHGLLRRNPKLYNTLAPEIDSCCPGLRELVSYLPVLSSSLTEPLPS